MADAGLFLGWGDPVRGREATGLEVLGEGLEYYARLQQEGRIESFETVLLEPHGGDLAGFILLRGASQQLAELRIDDEFERLTARAGMVVGGLGVVGAYLGDGLERAIGLYRQAVDDLAG
jgi:hypothetical protein